MLGLVQWVLISAELKVITDLRGEYFTSRAAGSHFLFWGVVVINVFVWLK